jgi:hypothetical protein
MESKKLVKENNIDEHLLCRVYHSDDIITVELSYKNGKRLIIKSFRKDYKGIEESETFLNKFKCSQDILDYFDRRK